MDTKLRDQRGDSYSETVRRHVNVAECTVGGSGAEKWYRNLVRSKTAGSSKRGYAGAVVEINVPK